MQRRQFLNQTTAALAGSFAVAGLGKMAYAYPSQSHLGLGHQANFKVATRNSAKNLIFVLLEGGASHVDTFDLKLRPETPALLGAQNLGGMQWPSGIMPKLATMHQKFSLVRSLTAVEAVHERAVYHLVTAHRPDASLTKEIPHFVSAMSYKLQSRRRSQDTLPHVVIFGEAAAKNGFFPIENRALELNSEGQIPNLAPFLVGEGSDARFQMLQAILPNAAAISDKRQERIRLHHQARQLMADTDLINILGTPTEEVAEEGAAPAVPAFRRQCEAVVRLLNANKGTRLVQMSVGDWDHHINIYNPAMLPARAAELDDGLAYLISSLEAIPAKEGTGTLLDETLIVVAGEFGRTTNGLNESAGRDHYPYVMSALFAGGGVRPGRVIGSSDATGSFVADAGWSQNRYMAIQDISATMYSALGIDWTETFTATPSGRPFELVPTVRTGQAYEIDSLFV